jgi:hypothetical protein
MQRSENLGVNIENSMVLIGRIPLLSLQAPPRLAKQLLNVTTPKVSNS